MKLSRYIRAVWTVGEGWLNYSVRLEGRAEDGTWVELTPDEAREACDRVRPVLGVIDLPCVEHEARARSRAALLSRERPIESLLTREERCLGGR